jgi:deoxyribonuclease V
MHSKNIKLSERKRNNLILEKFKKIQERLSYKIKLQPLKKEPDLIAGVDVSYDEKENFGYAAIVVMKWETFEIIEIKFFKGKVIIPYIPGFLSFREVPLILKCFYKLKYRPELIFVDGQGIAHPRKMGLATHLGILLNIPTIGCAKKPLIKCEYPDNKKGALSPIFLDKEIVGYALRTKPGVKPVFVSPGNLISMEDSIKMVLKAVRKYRIPEPLRLAHQFTQKIKK